MPARSAKIYNKTKEEIEEALKYARSVMDSLDKMGICENIKVEHNALMRRIKNEDINTNNISERHYVSNVDNLNRARSKYQRIKYSSFNKNNLPSLYTLRACLLRENLIPYICDECGNEGVWRDKKITLQIHHIDGNRDNFDLSNIVFLCPNCHTQTENWGSKNQCKNKIDI